MSTLTSNPANARPSWDDVEPTSEELARRRHEHWLENEPGIECIDGVILVKPVAKDSSIAAGKIMSRLVIAGEREGGWDVYDSSLGYKTNPAKPGNFRKPDLSAVLRSRAATDDDEGFFHLPADLVVEVVSRRDEAEQIFEKVSEYLAQGFGMVWVVLPKLRTVHVYRRGQKQSLVLGPDDTIDGGDVLPGFACKVAEFFAG
jgi:Uma2 family endonuclease